MNICILDNIKRSKKENIQFITLKSLKFLQKKSKRHLNFQDLVKWCQCFKHFEFISSRSTLL